MSASLIPASSLITELDIDEKFSARTEPEKIQILNRAGQEVASTDLGNGRTTYKRNNLASPLPSVSVEETVRRGFGSASILGTFVTFSSPLAMPYTLWPSGYKNGLEHVISFFDPDTGEDKRLSTGFTAYASDDGVTVEYRAEQPI